MATPLPPCVNLVFAQLPKESLYVIRDLSTQAITALAALKISKQTMSLNMDIALIPLQAKKQVLDKLIATARDATKVIPTELILQCPTVGAINTLLESSMVGALEGVSNMTFDIERLESIKSGVKAEIAQIDVAVDFFNGIIDSITEVLNTI